MTTESMKPYPAYKDSGIEWIGEIPEGWDVKPLKHVVKLINEKTDDVRDYKFKIELENIESFTGKLLNNLGTFEGIGNRFKKGDVLFNKLRPYLCKVVLVPDDGISVGELLTFRTIKSFSNKFLLYRLLSSDFISIVNGAAYGTKMPRASWEFIGNIKCPIPPLSEQQSIAALLDNQTAKIDTLIENKQKQIELLKEERTAIINQAVTKGLNPDVPMRDSGIEWLREIPEHWELVPLKYLLLDGKNGIKIGPFGSSLKSDIITSTGFKVYGQENIINDDFSIGHRFLDGNTFDKLNAYEIFENDILITMMGTTGKSKVVPANIKKGIMDSHLIRIRNNNNSNSHFISLLINDSDYIYSQLKKNSKGSIMEGLNSSIVKSLLIACPPLNEQKQILDYIQGQKNKLDYEKQISENQITLLKEYRTALISEAVTGKIDLRNQHEIPTSK